jgi:hypothetical protein
MKDKNSFALVICCFVEKRLNKFLKNFKEINPGIEFDLYFVHNCVEPTEIKNRYVRTDDEIHNVKSLIKNFKFKNKHIFERINIGEDLGAYHDVFNTLKDEYRYFFFMNEATILYENNWMKKFYDTYERNELIFATTPQICDGIKYRFCLPSTYWSVRSDFGKKMIWNKPLNRSDAELQEMELVYPQVKEHGGFVAQVGYKLMGYKNIDKYQEGLY